MGDQSPLTKDQPQNLFFKSVREGDLQELQAVLKSKTISDVDVRDQQGWTALMLAARRGHRDIVESLVEAGVDTTLVNKSGQTAYQIAEFWSHEDCCSCLDSNNGSIPQSKEVINFFAGNPLDRRALQRTDQSWLDAAREVPSTKYILLSKQSVYVLPPSSENKKYTLCPYSHSQVSAILDKHAGLCVILLGTERDGQSESQNSQGTESDCANGGVTPVAPQGAWFAVDVTTLDSGEVEGLNADAELLGSNLVSLMGFDDAQAGMLAQTVSMMSWHDRYRFCPTCGSGMMIEEAGYKRRCKNQDCWSLCSTHNTRYPRLDPGTIMRALSQLVKCSPSHCDCQWFYCRSLRGTHNTSYPRLDPVTIMLVIHPEGNKCLLGRKKMFPKGMFSCLAGFMEPGESIEDAVRREVKEESGIDVGRVRYHSSQPWPMPSQIMIGCFAWAESTEITVDENELEEVRWFTREETFEAVIQGHKGYTDRGGTGIFAPPRQAIAHQLMKAWATTSSHL